MSIEDNQQESKEKDDDVREQELRDRLDRIQREAEYV